jgi:hypothetical protein
VGGSWSLGRVWLKFPEGHPQHGLEVLMRRRLMREPEGEEVFDYLTDEQYEALPQRERQTYLVAQTEHRCKEFARLLIKWNLTEKVYDDDGEETGEEIRIPPTAEGVGHLDPATFVTLWDAYNDAVLVVAPPLQRRSDDGEPSEEALTLPQESLSPSPTTLDTL